MQNGVHLALAMLFCQPDSPRVSWDFHLDTVEISLTCGLICGNCLDCCGKMQTTVVHTVPWSGVLNLLNEKRLNTAGISMHVSLCFLLFIFQDTFLRLAVLELTL